MTTNDPTKNVNHADQDVSRRDLIKRLGASGLLLMGGSAFLTGCASSSQGMVGKPIPPDRRRTPVYEPPVRDTAQAPTTTTVAKALPAGVIPRDRWAAFGPDYSNADPMTRINKITVHHDGMNAFTATDMMSSKHRLESIRKAHLGNGWADIGYHYVVDPGGRIWEARPITLQGAHVKDQNPGNIGIMMMGNYEKQRPTRAALASIENFINLMRRTYGVSLASVYTHQELAPTACPGRELQFQMNRARSGTGVIARG